MNKNIRFSRRRFLTVSSLSLAGFWVGCSNQATARALRGVVADTGRAVPPATSIPDPANWDSNRITAAWLGHSTVLLNFFGVTILTDPALLRRIGANTWFGTIGARRLVAPALNPKQLPPIDLVMISHAHMDHLDFATLRALPGHPQAVTARATDDLLVQTKLKDPQPLGWGDHTRIRTPHGDLEVRAFEVKHWGARWRYDKHRGYNGYVLSREGKQVIFGGDTAACDSFRSLRSQGPYELAIMPIGAYKPWVCSHCTPEQAVRMANNAGAGYFLPIHFKTFRFGREGTFEPLQRLARALEPERLGWSDVGQTYYSA